MTDTEYLPIEGKQTALGHPLYRHAQTGDLHGVLSYPSGSVYYPVDAEGEPLDLPTGVHPFSKAEVSASLDLDTIDISGPPTRRYALENEDPADVLNHPNGTDWL